MNMQIRSLYLFVLVALVLLRLTQAQYQWSGFVNSLQSSFDYQCPDELVITGIGSVFNDAIDDRRWEFACGSGGNVANVTSSCTLQSPVHIIRNDIAYECPNNGYISGFQTTYSSTDNDRLWSPYCCTRNYSTLINCHVLTSNWENVLEGVLNWTTSSDRVLTGITSFFSAFNRDRRWRYKQCEVQVSCGDPGIPTNAVRDGDTFLYEDVVTFTCNHGYYMSSGDRQRVCQDTGLWSGDQPSCTLCTDIENCIDIRCTGDNDQYCNECASNHGVALGESGYRNLNTSCEPYCSWLGGFCYPGECPLGPSTCNCSTGFSGPDCLNIYEQPELNECTLSITSPFTLTTLCDVNSTLISYINYTPTGLSGEWRALFRGPFPSPEPPAYVQSYSVGITRSWIVASLYRHDSYPHSPASTSIHSCITLNEFSPNNPSSSLVSCNASVDTSQLTNHTFLHGDRFELGVFIDNGGFLNITDFDTNETRSHYYKGSPIIPSSLLIIDTVPPTHCSATPTITCSANQEDPLRTNLTNDTLIVTWGGWSDQPAGINEYQLEIYPLIYDPTLNILDKDDSYLYALKVTHDGYQESFSSEELSLSEEGPYSIVLTSTDNAGNNQYAHRIIIYDDTSILTQNISRPLFIIGGHQDAISNGYWVNSTTTPIRVSGRGHFYNTNFGTENWLAPVANHTPSVPPIYDTEDRFGVYNSLGITSLSYNFIIDQVGGVSGDANTRPASFPYIVNDLSLSDVQTTPTTTDGDSVSIWFQAQDYKGNSPAYEKVLVHVDSSPPVMEGLGLTRDGVPGLLYLHGSDDLLDLNIIFEAQDIHSGLYEIEWSIKTATNNGMIAQGELSIVNIDKELCMNDTTNCTCDTVGHCHMNSWSIPLTSSNFLLSSRAHHDTDYIIVVTATNHARLLTTLTTQFTVDLTPPLTGAIFDGRNIDLDYTSNLELYFHWNGFFDRETDILIYQYIISTRCVLDSDSFRYPNNMGMSLAISTINTNITWTAPNKGVYHITVVAYNKAYIATKPICSDGIIIDMDPPSFMGVVIPGGVVKEGLVRTGTSEGVWLIGSNRERFLVEGFNEFCVNRSTLISEETLSTFSLGSNRTIISSSNCHNYFPFNNITYTSIDFLFNISWTVADDNGIYDYEIAMATNFNVLHTPDILSFQSTAGHTHFSVYNSQLINGKSFYVFVKAIDFVSHVTMVAVGPIVIDVTPPFVNGNVSAQLIDNGSIFLVTWDSDSFHDNEDLFPLNNYEYSLGRTQYGNDVHSFKPIPNTSHPLCFSSYCITIATNELYPGNEYHVTIKITNSANLVTYVPLDPFVLSYPLPSPAHACLSVFDFDSSNNPFKCGSLTRCIFNPQSVDRDILFNPRTISIGWRGYEWDQLNISFAVAMGTSPGLSDVVPFTATLTNDSYYTFNDISLITGQRYYFSVRAFTEYSSFTVSSDGFIVLPTVHTINQYAFIWDGLNEQYDIDYQVSTTTVSAHWYYPDMISQHVSHYEWALFRENEAIFDYTSTGPNKYGIMTLSKTLELETLYITKVRACFKTTCLEPRVSDGFYLATPPNATLANVFVQYQQDDLNSDSGHILAFWESFQDPELQYYEWAIGTQTNGRSLLTPWTRIGPNINHLNQTLNLNMRKAYQSSYYFNLVGINRVGLKTSVSKFMNIAVPSHVPIVYDVSSTSVRPITVNDSRNLESFDVHYTDLDYTSSHNSLSAAWPTLKYTNYSISISTSPAYMSCDQEPRPLYCNTTIANTITVTGLELIHGVTYYFCVKALAENSFSPSPEGPQTITTCSDGIIIDLTPPTGECVQIVPQISMDSLPVLTNEERGVSGSGEEAEFSFVVPEQETHSCSNQSGSQSSISELHIVWNEFQDVQNENVPFSIVNYEYALGTSVGGEDIVRFTSVGVVREIFVTGLKLTEGLTYHATIRATDYTGQTSTVTSQGLTIDQTPPTINHLSLLSTPATTNTFTITSLEELRPKWDLIIDKESHITELYWCIGSQYGLSDVLPWTNSSSNTSTVSISDVGNLTLYDGQPLVLSLMAINSAGLSTIKSSRRIIYDVTPPCSARIFDGPRPLSGSYLDLDYTTNHTHLTAHWGLFSDPHTEISQYWFAIGSCKGCTDVMPFIDIGLTREYTKRYPYSHGKKYFISVRGCSFYSGCTTAHSDGIMIDVTGPITSLLHHGVYKQSLQFQASRYTLSCHWGGYPGFHDSQSKLSHFIYYVGTSPGDYTYIPRTTLPGSATSFTAHFPSSLSQLLPVNTTVYVTLEVYNRAGLLNMVYSKGVFITDSLPMIVQVPNINETWAGSLVNDTQYTGTLVHIDWDFTDTYTSINQYFWSLYTGPGHYRPLPPSHAYNTLSSTHTNMHIQDGSVLHVRVIGCNQVGICTSDTSINNVLIDSTPPIDGYFALHTTSSANVSWYIDNGMSWYNSDAYATLNFTFTGFSDPHSGVTEYWATIGSEYGKRDLFESVLSNVSKHPDNDLVSMAMLQLSRPLYINETIFVWLWALNGVGRESNIVQATFKVHNSSENSGNLELLRSQECPIVSCYGHCTCSERGHFCDSPAYSCQEIDSSFLSSDMKVTVSSLLSQRVTHGVPPFTAVNDKLSGEISHVTESPDFQWVEWSVGEINKDPGTGIIDTSLDPVWFPLGLSTGKPIFDVTPSLPLIQGKTYTIRARVWYNSTHYSNFVSQGALVDSINPQISQGFQLREVSTLNSFDIDYSASVDNITLQWDNVFNTMLSGAYLNYEIGLGDSPGADNIYKLTPIGNVTEHSLTSLNLEGNRKYYAIIKGTTPTGITAVSLSDGFTVDLTPPKTGVLFIGGRYHSNSAQSNLTSVMLRLLGFHDPESFISNYRIGISKLSESVTDFIDFGINLKPEINGLSLENGETYLITVQAINSAGNVMEISVTQIGDSTPPVPAEKNCTNKLTYDFKESGGNATSYLTNSYWNFEGSVDYVTKDDLGGIPFPRGGERALQVHHSISHTFNVDDNSILQVSFDVLASNGIVVLVCFNCQKTCDRDNNCCQKIEIMNGNVNWREVTFTYQAVSSSVKVDICAGNLSMTIDNVVLQGCNIRPSSNSYLDISPEPPFFSVPLSLTVPFMDTSSSIKSKAYSIGTTLGGTQIIPYTYIAPEQLTIYPNYPYDIQHNTSLYLSMAVTDFAGNSMVYHSEAILIDRTPPLVLRQGVKEIITEGGEDVDYVIGTSFVWIDWSDIVDEESGIKHCQWGLGTSQGSLDITNYTLSYSTSTNSSDLSLLISHGTKLYTTVTCHNDAGLFTTSHSDGVTLLYDPPTHLMASLFVHSPILDQWYESESGYLPSDSIQLVWSGFQDGTLNDSFRPPFHYQIRLFQSDSLIDSEEGWCDIGSIQQLSISSLNLTTNTEYEAQIRSYVIPSLISQPISTKFFIVPSGPVWNKDVILNVTWATHQIKIEWKDVFTSFSPLTYEISLGFQRGGTSVDRWVAPARETENEQITLSNSQLSRNSHYFLALNAIGKNGISTVANYMIDDMDISPIST